MKKYSSIKGYLERFSIANVGRLKIRWHKILSADGTPYLHNHPFSFLSVVLKGGYTEQLLVNDVVKERRHRFGSFILRKASDYHRIKEASDCRTLFFALDSPTGWGLKTHPSITMDGFVRPERSGIYTRTIDGKKQFCKFDEFWHIGSEDYGKAQAETRLSIHQVQGWEADETT